MSATTGDAPVKRRRGPQGGQGATRSQSKTSPEAIARLERDTKCVELRKAGLTFQEIAQRLGYASAGHARDRFLVMLREFPSETVEETRRLLRERYESMLRAIWPDVLRGKWLAIDRANRILENIARLEGANRPEQVQVFYGETELDAALRELEEQLRLRAAGQPVPQE